MSQSQEELKKSTPFPEIDKENADPLAAAEKTVGKIEDVLKKVDLNISGLGHPVSVTVDNQIKITKGQADALANSIKLLIEDVKFFVGKSEFSDSEKEIRYNLITETASYFKALFGIELFRKSD